MAMQGYVTEKIFDCLYAGTIPIYLGATDIDDLISSEAFIDFRNFSSWENLLDTLSRMPAEELQRMRNAGRQFVRSKQGEKYNQSLLNIFNVNCI